MRVFLILAMLLPSALLATTPAVAASKGAEACARAVNAVEQALCADAALAGLDARLNDAWNKRRAGLGDVELQALLADQRAWLRRRGEACDLPASGTVTQKRLNAAAACLADVYRLRIAALNGSGQKAASRPTVAVDPTLLHRAWLVNNRCQTLDFAGTALLGEAHDATLAGLESTAWAKVRDTATTEAAAIECNKTDQTAFIKQLVIKLGAAQ